MKKKISKKNLCFSGEDFKFDTQDDSRKFKGVAYSGQLIENHPWWGNLIFDVSSMKFKASVPVLMNHDMNRIVGSGSLNKNNNELTIDGEFSEITKDGIEAFGLVKKEKFPMQESVFILPSEIDELKTGSTTVNGIKVNAPATIFRGGNIKEVSMTPLGADENTSTEMFSFNINVNTNNKTNGREKRMKNKNFLKFNEILESQGEEEAWKFACACEKAKHEDSEDGEEKFSDENKSLSEENAQLKKDLADRDAKIAASEASKETEKKEMKIRRVKETFKKFGIEASEDVVNVYLMAKDDAKFDASLSGLEASLKTGIKETKATNLRSIIQVGNETKTTSEGSEALKFGVKQEVIDEENKIQEKALQFRKDNPKLTVADSRELARKSLGIVG